MLNCANYISVSHVNLKEGAQNSIFFSKGKQLNLTSLAMWSIKTVASIGNLES